MSTSTALPVNCAELPACLTRDNLTSPYFPATAPWVLHAVIALCVVFALTSFNRLNHTDLWGHLNFGRWIAEHGTLPSADPFAAESVSAQAGGQRMLHSAWLSQWLGYEVHTVFGGEGLVLVHALLMTAAAGVLMLAVVRRPAPVSWAWGAAAAMFALDLPIHGTIRPQLFGQLGAALFLLGASELSASHLPARRLPLVWLPLVAALWANLHGSVVIGLMILTMQAIGTTWTVLRECGIRPAVFGQDERLWPSWLAVILSAGGACLNPHGPLLLVRTISFGEQAALASITEWQPMSPFSMTGVLVLISLAATAVLVKRSPRRWSLAEGLLLLTFALATLSAIRMLAWWAIVWPWVTIPHAAAAWTAYRQKQQLPQPETAEPTAMRTVLAMGVVFMTVLLAPPSFALLTGRHRGEGPVASPETPLYLADELARRHLSGNLAAPMDWADYVVWKTEGRVRPLVYSHVHLAPAATWHDYQAIFRGDPRWLALLADHHVQYLAVSRQRCPELATCVALAARSQPPPLRIVYQDQRCILAELAASTR